MSKAYKWEKQQINGKPRIEKEWKNAQKFAIEVYKKFCKFNKSFEA